MSSTRYCPELLKAFVTLCLALSLSAVAQANGSFQVGCEDVAAIVVALGPDLEQGPADSSQRGYVVVCGIGLTPEGGDRFEAFRTAVRNEARAGDGDRFFAITGGGTFITSWDSTMALTPPGFHVVGKAWPEVRTKLMAICPDKMPRKVPQEVLDHRPGQP